MKISGNDVRSFCFALVSVASAASMVAGCGGGGGGGGAATGSTGGLGGVETPASAGTGTSGTTTSGGTTTTGGTTTPPTSGTTTTPTKPATGSTGTGTGTVSTGTTTGTKPTTGTNVSTASETPATEPGFLPLTGTLVSGADGASEWKFSSTKTLSYSPGSVSVDGSGKVVLKFDFGCQTANIVVRTTDCRNSVTARRLLPRLVDPGSANLLSVDVRNSDATGDFALMVWDSTGQVLRYPVKLRGIENRSANQFQRVYVAISKPSSYWNGANDGVLHGSIVAVAMSAQSLVQDFATGGVNFPAGSLEIGDIRLHTAPAFDYTLQTNAQRVASAYPSYKGRLTVASESLDPVYLDKAKEIGITNIRRDLNWEGTERSGRFNFNWYLNMMPEVQNRDMKVLWVLDYGHPEHGGSTPRTAADRQAYANFAQAVATAFKGKPVLAYELWNEPDSSIYWTSPDAAAFSDLVARATTGIKTADSSAKVVTGGVVLNYDTSYLFKLAGQTTNLSQVDAIGVHPYRFDSVTYTSPSYRRVTSTPESYAADQAVYARLLGAAGSNKPLWDTEAGYSSWAFLDAARYGDGLDTRALSRQGALTLRRVLTQLAIDSPTITLYMLYDTLTNATDREHNFGLLNAYLGEKPAYSALKLLYNSVGQLTFKGYLSDVPPNTHALRWDNTTTGGKVFVMWSSDTDIQTKVTLPAGVTAVKLWNGTTVRPTTNASGQSQITLTEDAGPVFIYVS